MSNKMHHTGFLTSLLFLRCIISSQSRTEADSAVFVISKFACENGVANLACPPQYVIEISSLFYGRNPEHGEGICSNGVPQDACEMTGFDKKEKLKNLKKACSGKTECNIIANDLTFGDLQKCPNVTKYLNIIFECPLPPPPSTTEDPSTTKEPVYYEVTSLPNTSSKPTSEPYIDLHRLDEDGRIWPIPRPVNKCNATSETMDEEDMYSAGSSNKSHFPIIVTSLILKFLLYIQLYVGGATTINAL